MRLFVAFLALVGLVFGLLTDLFISHILNLLTPDVLWKMRGKKRPHLLPCRRVCVCVCMAKALANIHTVFSHLPEAHTF